MLCIGLIGKITNNSTTNYKVSIEEIIEGIGSKGIKLLKPPEIDPTILAGQEWNLSRITEDTESNTVYVPRDSLIYQDSNNNYRLRFLDYETKPGAENSTADTIDNEERERLIKELEEQNNNNGR